MNNSKIIHSVNIGSEYLYIYDHFNKYKKSLIYICKDEREIFKLKEKIQWMLPKIKILIYRSWDQIPYDKVSPSRNIQSERIKVLYEIFTEKKNIILLTTINAIVQKTVNQNFLNENILIIKNKNIINRENFINKLISLGYQKTSIVREKSEFAIRGSLIDIFLTDNKYPVRIDFNNNQIDTLSFFDPLTQKRTQDLKTNTFIINASSELLLNDNNINCFRNNFRKIFDNYRISENYHSISEFVIPPGCEQYLPLFYDSMSNIFSYCLNYHLIYNSDIKNLIELRLENIQEYYEARIQHNEKFNLSPKHLYLTTNIIKNIFSNHNNYELKPFNSIKGDKFDIKNINNLSTIKKQIDFNFINNFFIINSKINKIIICVRNKGVLKRIQNIFKNNISIITSNVNNFSEINNNIKIYITVLEIENSVQFKNVIFLNEKTIFGYFFSSIDTKIKQKNVFFDEINKLTQNTILVHSEYGICRFTDIKKLKVDNTFHECIELEFANEQILYLPVENLSYVSKYSDDNNQIVKLDKLGNLSWQKRKSDAKNRIKDIAKNLINIAAKRLLINSYKINFENDIYDKFSSTFPFIETEDQIKAIEDIKIDFQQTHPTDRLIIGDVAYGKSEVILRSIFIAAKSSLQSIILVPTTLLSMQHFKNFSIRLSPFGIKVKQLSRLITQKEKAQIIENTKNGSLDVIIGTHALLNDKISFKKLGLIIIDEEQHFGVKAKEKLKSIAPKAHVLSLSATPIPRTLQLSLSGIRELSLIFTPPFNRLSINSYITPYDELTIIEAIKREIIGRKGGVFYVTPRKKDIPFLENFIKNKLPQFKYVVAHGKLSSKLLEERISKFYNGNVPILISTNIIESGLDLPNVNTIIINRANMFSLASLYQLKGRVGRSTKRGYAYLTYQKKDMRDTSFKRLNIINTYDKLGSGFSISSSDMDMRGSGNIVGEAQSGHVKEVGTELYNQLLNEEILRQKNEILNNKEDFNEILFQPTIKIPEPVYIPDDYIPDLDIKISLYKRIALIKTNIEKENIITEMIDRFGELPNEVENLFRLIEIKILCLKQNIEKIDFGKKGILFSFFKNTPTNPKKLISISLNAKNSIIKLRSDQKIFYSFNGFLKDDRFELVKKIINDYIS